MKIWVLVFVAQFVQHVSAQSFFKTSLRHGPHKVGFKAGVHYDIGRPPIEGQFTRFQQGRAVHISVWYPAKPKPNHPPMIYGEYVDEISSMLNPTEINKKTRNESIHQFNVLLSQLGGDSLVLEKYLGPLLNSATSAYRNALAQSGSFPLVFYPESLHLNNILCEFIASYGYIVVSVSRHGTFLPDFEWQTVSGIETLIQDCQFALTVVSKEFASAGKPLAVMGTGMNASAGLGWMMRNPSINTLISLDGGILTRYEYELIQKSPFFNNRRVTNPLLVMHSPHEAVDAEMINHYPYADRYMLNFPELREFYYLNFGVWEKSMPGILGPSPGNTKAGFEWMARYTLSFLDWQLKHSMQGKIIFEEASIEQSGVPEGLVEFTFKQGIDLDLDVN